MPGKTNTSKPSRKVGRKPKGAPWLKSRAIELAESGLSQREIGNALDLNKSTIGKYLQEVEREQVSLKAFRDKLGDSLVTGLAKMTVIENKLLDTFMADDVLLNLTAYERIGLLNKLSVSKGIIFDKIRLHEGKSTSNNSHEIQLKQVHATLPFPTVNPISSSS